MIIIYAKFKTRTAGYWNTISDAVSQTSLFRGWKEIGDVCTQAICMRGTNNFDVTYNSSTDFVLLTYPPPPRPPGLLHKMSHGQINIDIKMESIRKLSNQWTKTLYQNNLKFLTFFFTLFKSYRRNKLFVITPKTISYGSP